MLTVVDLDRSCGRHLRFRDLIEAGETWRRVRVPNLPQEEWAKLRERNEALDCAVLARAALWLLGADRYGDRFWQQLREQVANAPLQPSEIPTGGNVAPPPPPQVAPGTHRPRGWLSPRSSWLR